MHAGPWLCADAVLDVERAAEKVGSQTLCPSVLGARGMGLWGLFHFKVICPAGFSKKGNGTEAGKGELVCVGAFAKTPENCPVYSFPPKEDVDRHSSRAGILSAWLFQSLEQCLLREGPR